MMAIKSHAAIQLKDYEQPNFWAKSTYLLFQLREEECLVTSKVSYEKNTGRKSELRLNGKNLDLLQVRVNDKELRLSSIDFSPEHLFLKELPDSFELELVTRIKPQLNLALEGLYRSGEKLCTQCEPEGFRRITYYLDRPDVMSEYTTRIEAEKSRYPILLSNGNLIESGAIDDQFHFCTWHDPFPKPSYLFALVAGNLAVIKDQFRTKSGRDVCLKIFVEPWNQDKCAFAMEALKQAMSWDEDVYGLEYDLDIFMIVAVSDFNMGAMENKGLNIFNSKYILAKPETATDQDFEAIQTVVGHEYFHNWTGNRVTCRDWFQLSLKEGLTVFRDQEFSADLGSPSVRRIGDVTSLRNSQFLEDSGPMAHPVRPDSYIEINNFYTATVYNKGAEVIRMIYTILGHEKYMDGIRLYFERHDGQAVTVEDFVAAMEDGSGIKLDTFMSWYFQAGTPTVKIRQEYHAKDKKLALHCEQIFNDSLPKKPEKPYLIPIKSAFLGSHGQALKTKYHAQQSDEHVLILEEKEQTIWLEDVAEKPVPSLLRDFSAPIFLDYQYSKVDLRFLLAHDTNDFNRYEAAQNLAITIIKARLLAKTSLSKPEPDDLTAFQSLLLQADLDARLVAKALTLPSVEFLTNSFPKTKIEDLYEAREWLMLSLAEHCQNNFLERLQLANHHGEYAVNREQIADRELKRICLHFLCCLKETKYFDLAYQQFQQATNMTDTINALSCLVHYEVPQREQALNEFFEKWQDDELVIDKWFAVQASSNHPEVLLHVEKLVKHPHFNILKPNRVYSVLRQFIRCNPKGFHHPQGRGYQLMADHILKIDPNNSQVASLLATALSQWRSFNQERQDLMKQELQRIQMQKNLSRDTFEVIQKSLAGV
ncbi:MAG: aminopeptidase N [Oligoflexus sp.]